MDRGHPQPRAGLLAIGRPIGQPLVHQDSVEAVAYSPDGKTILTGSHAAMARLWETPAPLPDDLPHLIAWVETLTGLELDEQTRQIDCRIFNSRNEVRQDENRLRRNHSPIREARRVVIHHIELSFISGYRGRRRRPSGRHALRGADDPRRPTVVQSGLRLATLAAAGRGSCGDLGRLWSRPSRPRDERRPPGRRDGLPQPGRVSSRAGVDPAPRARRFPAPPLGPGVSDRPIHRVPF